MPKLIIVSCLMLFWAFYETSGGADFSPRERVVPLVKAKAEIAPEEEPLVVETAVVEPEPVVEEPVENVQRVSYRVDPVLVSTATPRSEPSVEEQSPATGADLVQVAGEWVNMRDGPSTDFGVLDTLPRGTQAEVIDRDGTGWAQIRIIESGAVGWMAEHLLSDI